MGFLLYPEAAVGAVHLIEVYGTQEQKDKYMYKIALDLVGRKMSQKKGANFINFLGEINKTLARYKDNPRLADISKDVHDAVNLLADMGMFFVQCGKEGKYLIPISNVYPFLNLMGTVALG